MVEATVILSVVINFKNMTKTRYTIIGFCTFHQTQHIQTEVTSFLKIVQGDIHYSVSNILSSLYRTIMY